MLARHLLFIATRRSQNSLLAIPPESVPPHGIVPPPPYIPPPKVDERQSEKKSKDFFNDTLGSQKIQAQNEKPYCERSQIYPQDIYAHNAHRNFYDNNSKFFERNNPPMYNDVQRDRQIVQLQNAKNQQYYVLQKDLNQQFYTLPTRRPQREVEPPRSVTPDITRGLNRGSLSAMHMLARQGQKSLTEQNSPSHQYRYQTNTRNDLQNYETKKSLTQNQDQRVPLDMRNRFPSPLSLNALGYRFFASSPVHDPVTKSPSADALKHNPISPIGHAYGNGYRSCTPTGRTMPTVAERLALTTGRDCSSPVSNSSGRSTPVQTSSGRSTPTNMILSPTKSTMSNEELFAAIHKSKRRLNIKDDSEALSPAGSMTSLVKMPATKQGWVQMSQKPGEVTQNVHSPSATSRLDFKRLLLQQSVKSGSTRLSAAEQLKLSRQQCQQQQQSLSVTPQVPLAKVLSPRSAWRFQTPRTDVLSSTIIEDTAAEEKAMKPSPENTSPLSRLNSRRQLNLCSDLPENLHLTTFESKPCDTTDNNASSNKVDNDQRLSSEPSAAITTDNRLIESLRTFGNNTKPTSKDLEPRSQSNVATLPTEQYLSNVAQRTPECQGAISAFESRRISNQLARAQFLSSTPVSSNQQGPNAFKKRFRARSESPQHPATQNVARSPSAPTLETAL